MSTEIRQAKTHWNLREALLLLLIISLVQSVIYLLGVFDLSIPFNLALWTLTDGLMCTAVIFLFIRLRARVGWAKLGLHSRNISRSLLAGLLVGILTALVALGVGRLIVEFIGKNPDPQLLETMLKQPVVTWQLWVLTIAVAILVPFKEEIVFRGFLYPAMRDRVGVKWGIVLTAILFGLAHGDLLRFFPLVLGGIALNLVYEYTGSLFSSIVAHGVWNGVMVLLVIFWG